MPLCVGIVIHAQLGAGSWPAGSVPVVISDAEIVTFDERACPLTVVPTATYPGTVGDPVNVGDANGAAPVTCATE